MLLGLPALLHSQDRVEFEVASIKPASDARISDGAISSMQVGKNRVELRGYTARAIVKFAYRLQDYQISGGPKWLDSDRYDIDAKPSTNGTVAQIPQMVQSLLADRCQLVVHHETQQVSGYEMTVAKNGSKLVKAELSQPGGFGWGSRQISSRAGTIAELAENLANTLQRPVVDKTGIEGLYQIKLSFAPVQPDPNDDGSRPALPAALQEQLGLKLESARVPVDVIVIDRAEKPSAN